ncbi:MAG: TolC family protein [Magnetococcales bacterium]|nr:TolC family protein [Magnetococcales bacterium]
MKHSKKWHKVLPVTTVMAAIFLSGCAAPNVQTASFTKQDELAGEDYERIFDGQPKLEKPLSMYDAMARAIRYNLNYRLKRMESAVASGESDVANLDMLPRLTLAAGYSIRNSQSASYSKNLTSGTTSSEATSSSEKQSLTSDLSMSWNLLDFGVSYFQARQAKNQQLIQDELRRKALHNLLKDVRVAFWKAMASQELEREISVILATAENALDNAKKVKKKGQQSPVNTLQYEIGMLEIIRQLEKARVEMLVAREDLAGMINLSPGATLKLLDDSGNMANVLTPEFIRVQDLERFALASRPELRVELYQSRIEADEANKAIARLFPGLELNVGGYHDSNSLQVHQNWIQSGARLSWNIMRLLTVSDRGELFSTREKTVEARRLAQHMAILTQSRIAYHEFLLAQRDLKLTNQEEGARGELKKFIGNRSRLGLDSQLQYVRSAAEATLGRIRQYESYTRYQNAIGNIYATMGMDIVPEKIEQPSTQMLARSLRGEMRKWQDNILANMSNPVGTKMVKFPMKTMEAIIDERQSKNRIKRHSKKRVKRYSKNRIPVPVPLKKIKAGIRKAKVIPRVSAIPRAKVVTPVTTSKKRFNVQVAAFINNKDQYLHINVMKQLRKRGYEPMLKQTRAKDGTAWRLIWLGSYDTRSEAEAVRDKFINKEGKDAFISTVQINP